MRRCSASFSRCLRARFGDRGLEELDRVTSRIFHEDLLAADARDDVVAEAGAALAQPGNDRLDVFDLELEAIPPSWLGQAPVGHCLPAARPTSGCAEYEPQVPVGEHANVGAGCMSSWKPSCRQ